MITPAGKSLDVLLVDDSSDDVQLIVRVLESDGLLIDWQRVETLPEVTAALDDTEFDVVLVDFRLPQCTWLEVINAVKRCGLDLPVIMVSGTIGEQAATEVMRAGARDFFVKDRLERLPAAIRREVAEAATRRDRRAAEAELVIQQQRFQALVERSSEVISVIDRDATIIYASPTTERVFGYTIGEFVGHNAFEFVMNEDVAAARELFLRLADQPGATSRATLRCRHKDDRIVWTEVVATNLLAESAVRGIVINYRDITERKQVEQQFFEAQRMEAFGQLTGGIAHDFNNVLAVLVIHFDLMMLEPDLPPKAKATLKELERAASRAANLVRQLLIFSRRHAMATQAFDLNPTIEDVCRMLGRVVGESIAFKFVPAPEPAWVEADPSMVEQVVMNLCVNARDAMPRGGSLTVSVWTGLANNPGVPAGEPRKFAAIVVEDTGHGMDEKTKARIFEPFFTTKPIGRGTGLGLATVHGIAKQHGGWVDVETAVNVGTTFRVYLPAASAAPAAIQGASRPFVRGTGRILVVEDDDGVRSTAAECLRMSGYEVVEAADGLDAEDRWDERGFDLLLTDVIMPRGMTGHELAQRLVERRPSLKVIVMTGYSPGNPGEWNPDSPENVIRITKPFSANKLLEAVSKLLAKGETELKG